ncbi:MAG TPA: alpha/beta hydrolase [Ilumatobacter sp.]|nr:alpha/beta hydrolase [Ilumatobacter sp.]
MTAPMQLDGGIAFVLAALDANADQAPPTDLAERRAAANAGLLAAGKPDTSVLDVTDTVVDGPGGPIAVRIHRPRGADGTLPGVLFVHGGGWFQGNLDTSEVEGGPLAADTPAVVVHLDYRLAPEHPYPAALDDCRAVWDWLVGSASELGADPERLAVAGVSAGGNLAAALCLTLAAEGAPTPNVAVLGAPALDLTLATLRNDPEVTALRENERVEAFVEAIDEFAGMYLPDPARAAEPGASPLLAPDLSGIPPTVVVVGEFDPLLADCEGFVARLHAAGVPATGVRLTGHSHGTWIMRWTPTAHLVSALMASAVRDGTAGRYPRIG